MSNTLDQQTQRYEIELREGALTRQFSDEEKQLLRPIAEVLALLDGNAFFTMDLGNGREWYEQYLPEAWSIFEGSGGVSGWAGEMSWVKDAINDHPAVVEARNSLSVALKLTDSSRT